MIHLFTQITLKIVQYLVEILNKLRYVVYLLNQRRHLWENKQEKFEKNNLPFC